MTSDLLLVAGAGFALALAAVPAAARLGLLDVPSSRSSHARPVPRTGGIGLAAALAGAVVLAATLGLGSWTEAWRWLLPATAAFLVGLLDDVRRLRPSRKFVLQAGACALAVACGLRWEGRGLGPFGAIEFGAATPVMTWLWLFAVGIVVNFVDGIDLITCATTAVLLGAGAAAGAGPADGGLFAAAAGATVGLAAWNATPARVFAGDAGTHLLGFLVGSLACSTATGATHALPWPLAAAPLLPGVVDVGWGIAAKLRRGQPFWAPHNDHLYQRLTRAGWSHAQVALRYAALVAAAFVVVGRVGPDAGLGACLALGAVILGTHLGHGARISRRPGVRMP